MANLVSKIIKLKAKEFNILRKKLAPVDSYAWLLEKAGMSGNFNRTFIISDWYYKYNDFKVKMHVFVATEDTNFISALDQATDVTINGVVYEIDKRDVIQPDGQRAWWEFYCSRTIDTFTEDDL